MEIAITVGQVQWILFWIAVFGKSDGLWVVWIGSLLFLH